MKKRKYKNTQSLFVTAQVTVWNSTEKIKQVEKEMFSNPMYKLTKFGHSEGNKKRRKDLGRDLLIFLFIKCQQKQRIQNENQG